MSISIEKYKDSYFLEVLNLFNENSEFDFFTEELLENKLNGDPRWNPETTLVAIIDAKIIAFMQGVEQTIRGVNYGFIKLMIVSKELRRQHIATKMYLQLENYFREKKTDIVRFYDTPLNYYMPGIDPKYTPAVCFVQKLGFKKFEDSFNMTVSLEQDFSVENELKSLEKEAIEVKRAEENEKEELLNFAKEEWELWQNEIKEAYKNEPIAVHIAKLEGKIKAFSLHSANNKGLAWFGPMGTHADMRGKGIGSILLKLCLQDLKNQGYKTAIIPWVAPTAFYSHYVGAQITRVFWRYKKELN